MILSIHGKKMSMATPTASIFGIKTRVISLTWVAAWNMLTIRPATKPKIKTGAANSMATFSASIINPVTNSGDMAYDPKLLTNEPTIRYQPSANTNSMSLKGKDIIIGGNIIIPIERRTLATTMSIIRKGT